MERRADGAGAAEGDADLDAEVVGSADGVAEGLGVGVVAVAGAAFVSAKARLEVCAACSGIDAVASLGGRVSCTFGRGGGCTGCAIDVSGTEALRGKASGCGLSGYDWKVRVLAGVEENGRRSRFRRQARQTLNVRLESRLGAFIARECE